VVVLKPHQKLLFAQQRVDYEEVRPGNGKVDGQVARFVGQTEVYSPVLLFFGTTILPVSGWIVLR